EVDTRSIALWGEATWHVTDDLRVVAGLRAESHHFDYTTNIAPYTGGRFKVPEDRTDAFDLVTPKLGAIWTLGDVDLYANYSRGERVPQVSDLYRLQFRQNAGEIEPESLDSIEIGLRGEALDGALFYDISAYHMEKENYFFRDSDGLNVTDGATEHTGIEGVFSWQILPDTLKLDGQVSWSDQTYAFDRMTGNASESIRDGDEIDSAPEWLGDLALVWTPTDAISLRFSSEYVGEYYTNPANTADYPGHTVFSARGDYALTDGLDLFLILRNLTDERYADRADFAFGNPRYFPGEPLNATVGVKAHFD
ncbi:MAG: TonB-dependent receptor, partial [Hyphomonadaceae bacterium]|nr:TonB-dependent receptor [Hyphomonadaceae bacterium]